MPINVIILHVDPKSKTKSFLIMNFCMPVTIALIMYNTEMILLDGSRYSSRVLYFCLSVLSFNFFAGHSF